VEAKYFFFFIRVVSKLLTFFEFRCTLDLLRFSELINPTVEIAGSSVIQSPENAHYCHM